MTHIKVWVGSARVIDMTHAGKVGKRCEVLRVSGTPWEASQNEIPDQVRDREAWETVAYYLLGLDPAVRDAGAVVAVAYADIVGGILARIIFARADGVPKGSLDAYPESIRGIDAPRPRLTCGVSGKWGGYADERGICLRDYRDINEWTEITHDQTGSRAYAIAAKVWPHVQGATRLSDAADILRAAGAKLHGYCGLD